MDDEKIEKKKKDDIRTTTIRAPTIIKKDVILSEFDDFDKQVTSLRKKNIFFAFEKRKELIISLLLASVIITIGIIIDILF